MNLFGNDFAADFLDFIGGRTSNKSSEKDHVLRKNLQACTYPDETKYKIEKAVKQVFHIYPHFHPELLIFNEGGYQKIYIELQGILQVEIKGAAKKIDFYMMLLPDYPRSPPQVRIVNKNLDFKVDSFYQGLKSTTDPYSYLLNEKLATTKNWHPSNTLVHVILESSDLLKNKFPFCKSISGNIYGGNNANGWQYSRSTQNNVARGNLNAGNITNAFSVAQKLVRKEKATLDKINNQYLRLIDINQHLDRTKQSLESQETYLRKESYEMAIFLQLNESHPNLDFINLVEAKDESSEQILNLVSSINARQDSLIFLQEKFNQRELTLEDFFKQIRRIQQDLFQQKYLLQKCVKGHQVR